MWAAFLKDVGEQSRIWATNTCQGNLMCVHPLDLGDQQRGIYNLTYYGVTLTGYWGHLSEPGQGCNVALSTSSVFHVLDCLTLMPL